MTDPELDALISEIMTSVLQVPVAPGANLSRSDEERWNSLKHIELILSIESALDIQFSDEEIAEITCVDDLKKRILAKHAS